MLYSDSNEETVMARKMSELLYLTNDLAREAGVSPETIRVWQRKGILNPRRTPSGARIYNEADRRRALAYRQSRVAV
jgi:DNA-binding transcriptional MerR regulator